MSNFYLPVYDKKTRNNIKIYNMEYNNETLTEFLEYVRTRYQDRHLAYEDFNINSGELYEYNVNPIIYSIFCDVIRDQFLKLRSLGLYLCVNFNQKIPSNYTENEKNSILLQLKKDKTIDKEIHVSAKDEISNEIYIIEQANLKGNLTISEKDMLISEFEGLVVQFFDLFEIYEINYKRHHSKNFDFETPVVNREILGHDAFQKVYKKIF